MTKEKIIKLLRSTEREGINQLISYLEDSDFFKAPASTRYHRSIKGGLADHSLKVYELFNQRIHNYGINISQSSIILVSLLHDLCKIGLYEGVEGAYTYNYAILRDGHSWRSIRIILKYIQLNALERAMILYHMGAWGSHESHCKGSEYFLQEYISECNRNPIVSLFHECDNQEAKWIQ